MQQSGLLRIPSATYVARPSICPPSSEFHCQFAAETGVTAAKLELDQPRRKPLVAQRRSGLAGQLAGTTE